MLKNLISCLSLKVGLSSDALVVVHTILHQVALPFILRQRETVISPTSEAIRSSAEFYAMYKRPSFVISCECLNLQCRSRFVSHILL